MAPAEEKIDFNQVRFEILTTKHNTNKFCCNVQEIDEFIHKEAMDFQNERLGVTYLLFLKGKLIGFVTLSMADLRKEKMEEEERLRIGKENYPALQISQLARQKDLVDQDIGTFLCDFCLGKAEEFSEKVGCRFLVLNARRKVIGFYEKYGFKLLPRQEQRREPIMYLNIFSKGNIE
jgi:GNAT superfamily N-acetyltransferase